MENEIIPTPQAPVIPPEIIEPKKKILWPMITGVIIVLLLGFILYQQKQILTLTKDKKDIVAIPTTEPTSISTIIPEPTKTVEQEISLFINPKNDPNFTFEIKKTEGDFALVGYENAWHILKKEAETWKHLIGVNGDWVCDVIFKENIPPILVDYGCIYSDKQKGTYGAYKYNQSLKKWEIETTHIDLEKQKLENLKVELLPFINPKNDPDVIFEINKTDENFAYISIGSKTGPGVATIWKKENEKWRKLLATQDAWECEIVINEKIPPTLVDNTCFYYKTQETWGYNTAQKQWYKK